MLLENNPYPQDGRVRRESRALAQAGYEVTVISPSRDGQPWRDVVRGVRVYRYPFPVNRGGVAGYLWEYGASLLAALLLSIYVYLRHGFDIIHSHNPPDTFVLVAALFRPLGVRYIYDHHDLAPEMYDAHFEGGNRLLHRLLLLFEWLSCRMADHVIATNESYKAMEMQRNGVPESHITIVRNGPDPSRVRLVEPDAALRAKGTTIIGYVGDMGFHDGLDYLLRAVRHLVYDLGRTDCYCVLIGRGDAWDKLHAMTGELGIADYVWMTGWIPDEDFVRYLSTVDICVDPDPYSPFNDRSSMIKMTEYMALGKPIVAFDLTEHRYTAQEAALYVPPNDELAFARALATLMDDPQRREEMGAAGRRRIETELAWKYSVQHLLRAYSQVLS